MAKPEIVDGSRVRVMFDGRKCIHSRHCVLGRPDVFVPNAEGEWIHPDKARPEEVAEIAHLCPSGAIRYERLDGGPQEAPPKVNIIRLRENGPLAVHADAEMAGERFLRATLCRCGKSNHKPLCDLMHTKAGFAATGEPPNAETPKLEKRDGTLKIEAEKDGPYHVTGNFEIVTGTGRTLFRGTEAWLCRCGHSKNKPFCDSTHKLVGFRG
ncbi:MAG: CDGSH iron-sulfur domain-containing protein [Alphaproteobacteria bacterium]